jgi:hypothetical protein
MATVEAKLDMSLDQIMQPPPLDLDSAPTYNKQRGGRRHAQNANSVTNGAPYKRGPKPSAPAPEIKLDESG